MVSPVSDKRGKFVLHKKQIKRKRFVGIYVGGKKWSAGRLNSIDIVTYGPKSCDLIRLFSRKQVAISPAYSNLVA